MVIQSSIRFAVAFATVITILGPPTPSSGQSQFGPPNVLARPSDLTSPTLSPTADFDKDGDQDVLAFAMDGVLLYPNDGSGAVGEPIRLSDGASAAFPVDIDGDGDEDILLGHGDDVFRQPIYVSIGLPSGYNGSAVLEWMSNDGHGGFTLASAVTTSLVRVDVVTSADLDGDGDPDLVAIGRDNLGWDSKMVWYPNDGSGVFGEERLASGDYIRSNVVTAADMNADGSPDLVVVVSNSVRWFENDGHGNFESHTVAASSGPIRDARPVDMDRDGDLDLLLARAGGWGGGSDAVQWSENDGRGGFGLHKTIDDAQTARSVQATDFDGDGDMDVIGASWEWESDSEVRWYENLGGESFAAARAIPSAVQGPNSLVLSDIDGDGADDILCASTFDGGIDIISDTASPAIELNAITRADVPYPTTGKIADVNNDGLSDLIVVGHESMAMIENQGNGVFSRPQLFPINDAGSGTLLTTLAEGDFDADGDLDVVVGSNCTVRYMENDGAGGFSGADLRYTGRAPTPLGAYSLDSVDFDNDGDADILTVTGQCLNNTSVAWFRNLGGGIFERIEINSGNHFIATPADVDGDGDSDVFASGPDGLLWYANDGAGAFGDGRFISANVVIPVVAADLDGNGTVDVAAIEGDGGPFDLTGSGSLIWYPNDGLGGFDPARSIDAPGFSTVVVTDVDSDGAADLLLGGLAPGAGGEVAWLKNMGGGMFGPARLVGDYAASGIVYGDLSGDGRPDVVTIAPGTGEIHWYENALDVAAESYNTRPTGFRMSQNFPNPFSGTSTLTFEVPRPGPVQIDVFDLMGRLVSTVADGYYSAGPHHVVIDGRELPSGAYLCQLTARGARESQVIVIAR